MNDDACLVDIFAMYHVKCGEYGFMQGTPTVTSRVHHTCRPGISKYHATFTTYHHSTENNNTDFVTLQFVLTIAIENKLVAEYEHIKLALGKHLKASQSSWLRQPTAHRSWTSTDNKLMQENPSSVLALVSSLIYPFHLVSYYNLFNP